MHRLAVFALFLRLSVLAAAALLIMNQRALAEGSGTSGDPFTTLADAYTVGSSGRYYFNTGSGLFQADVDTSEGGGWVLVLQYVHQSGTNPALSTLGAGADLPVLSSAALGTDESSVTANWGHAGNAAMSQFTGDIELRWYGETSNHSRIIHFRSTLGDDYWRTGVGSIGTGLASDFTALTSHSAFLPALTNTVFSNQGDLALTEFPFYRSGSYHWGIDGNPNRWEVDDSVGGGSYDTIHRVWVRQTNPLEVTNTNDSGEGSLRQAISIANDAAALDDISFAIPGAGPHRITLGSAFPNLSDDGITIDGSTQSGASCGQLTTGTQHNLEIELDGNGASHDVLTIPATNATIRGVSIGNSGRVGINAYGAGFTAECNYIGVWADGVTAAPLTTANNFAGISISADSVTVDNNLISGSNTDTSDTGLDINFADGASVTGNIIGMNAAGTAARPNGFAGIYFFQVDNATVGGTTAATRNIVSGNTTYGIFILGGTTVDVLGNYVGTDINGSTSVANGAGAYFGSNTVGLTFGSTASGGGNVVSGNTGVGLELDGLTTVTVLGNSIGLNAGGTAALGNGTAGILVDGVATLDIGDGSAAGRNVIAGNTGNPEIQFFGSASSNVDIAGNFIGTDATGNAALSNGGNNDGNDGIQSSADIATLTIRDNVIGGVWDAAIELWAGAVYSDVTIQSNNINVGADDLSNISGSGRSFFGEIALNGNITNLLIGGTGAGEGNVIAYGAGDGIQAYANSVSGAIVGNTIRNNASEGIEMRVGNLAIYSNSIYSNGGLGIDLKNDGVTGNDGGGGDADSGPNDLLNFPVLNTVSAGGSTTVNYDFDLDTETNSEGYRIEFFKDNVSGDTYGEGQTYLGFVETGAYTAGSSLNFNGSFTASETVDVGDTISATTTRKTGASSYDATSEFAANSTTTSPLIVINTNDSGTGSLRAAMTFANANASEDDITFDIPGAASDVHTITLASSLPAITDDDMFIDGTSQGDAACGSLGEGVPHTLRVEIDGGNAAVQIFTPNADGVTLSGIAVGNSQGKGIFTDSDDGLTIECSYWGVRADGITGWPLATGTITVANQFNAPTNLVLDNILVSGNIDDGDDVPLGIYGGDGIDISGSVFGLTADGTTALANARGLVVSGVSNLTIGGSAAAERTVFSGNSGVGLSLGGSSGVTVTGTYIGTDVTGGSIQANSGIGLAIHSSSSNITLGGTGAGEGNIVSGNSNIGIQIADSSNVSLLGNHVGIAADGSTGLRNVSHGVYADNVSNLIVGGTAAGAGNVISSNGSSSNIEGLWLDNGTSATILGNFIGTDSTGTLDRGNRDEGIVVQDGSIAAIGDGTLAGRNVIAGNGGANVYFVNSASGDVNGNLIGIGTGGEALGGEDGVHLAGSSSGTVRNNTIAHHSAGVGNGNGVLARDTGTNAAIYSNTIFSNSGLGINLGPFDGVTLNDGSDGDSGPNDYLNFPVLNSIGVTGTTSVAYDISLDVPAHGDGYRIEFFKNSAADSSGYGEGEDYLGFVDVAGSGAYTGSFTAATVVSAGEHISATTTRKTTTSFDITSEFSLTIESGGAELEAISDVAVYDPTSAGLYMAPGNDVVYSLLVRNIGLLAADTDSIVLIERVPDELEFYNGTTSDFGNNVFGWSETGSGLTFTEGTDAAFSNAVSAPANFAACTYTPSGGYDPAVTYICLNPKGSLLSGSPDPEFTIQYRARIK